MPQGSEDTAFQHLFGAILLAVVAVLVLASLAYGGGLAWVKVLIGLALLGVSGWLLGRWARARRGPGR
jgi:thiol:disulfide interchange protein